MVFCLILAVQLIQWSINKTGRKLADLPVHAGVSGPFMTPGASSQKHDLMQSPRGKLFALDTDGNHMLTCSSRGGVIYKVLLLLILCIY